MLWETAGSIVYSIIDACMDLTSCLSLSLSASLSLCISLSMSLSLCVSLLLPLSLSVCLSLSNPDLRNVQPNLQINWLTQWLSCDLMYVLWQIVWIFFELEWCDIIIMRYPKPLHRIKTVAKCLTIWIFFLFIICWFSNKRTEQSVKCIYGSIGWHSALLSLLFTQHYHAAAAKYDYVNLHFQYWYADNGAIGARQTMHTMNVIICFLIFLFALSCTIIVRFDRLELI